MARITMVKQDLAKKIGKALIATTLTYIGVSSIAAAQGNPSTLETQVSTSEVKLSESPLSTPENTLTQRAGQEKKAYTLNDFYSLLEKAVEDKVLDYEEIVQLNGVSQNMDFNPRQILDSPKSIEKFAAINRQTEEKIIKHYEALIEGREPEVELETNELLLYIITKENSSLISENIAKRSKKIEEYQSYLIYYLKTAESWKNCSFVKKTFINAGIVPSVKKTTLANPQFEEFLKKEGYGDVKVKTIDEKFPVKLRVPHSLGLTFGIVFPFLRNFLLVPILNRKNRYGGNGTDYVLTGCTASVNVMLGIFVDVLHPLVYPIRVFGTPIIIQPLRKLIFGDKTIDQIL